MVICSPVFTAPEVLQGQSPTPASDVYSLGATLFSALTGHAAFERRSGEQVVAHFLRVTSAPVSELQEIDIPDDVRAAIGHAMAQSSGDRPATAAELGEELRESQRRNGLTVVTWLCPPLSRRRSVEHAGIPAEHVSPVMSPVRVVVAEDDVLLREGLASLLDRSGFAVGGADDGAALLSLVRETAPELVITDIRMPPSHTTEGLDAARTIREEFAEVAFWCSPRTSMSSTRWSCWPAAAAWLLLKSRVTDVSDFIDTLGRIARGASVVDPALVSELVSARRRNDPLAVLSEREREVLALMAEGRSNAGIAHQIWVTEGTVENPEDLTERQTAKLAWIAKTDTRLYRAYLLKEGLRHVFSVKGEEGKQALDRWISWARRCRIPVFVELAGRIVRHRQAIDAALDHGLSQGLIESTNTKIRVLTRVAFGFHSAEALIALAMLALGGHRPALPGRA